MTNWDLPIISVGHEVDKQPASVVADALKERLKTILKHHQDTGVTRSEIAHRMSVFLGTKISEAVLNQYVAKSAGDKHISFVRLLAFIQATNATELVGFIASQFGLHVVEAKYARLIERELLKARLKQLEDDISEAEADTRRLL
ncbi:MAG: hypothetical protein JKY49_08220 [Cohaesibacteraceae bacterium]|nr:hypothetical protein [Cohaesibacteraceae bacterium]